MEKEWEQTEDFHEKWRDKSFDVLAKAEFRKRKLETRVCQESQQTGSLRSWCAALGPLSFTV